MKDIIEITEEIKIGSLNLILERGDKIEIINESSDLLTVYKILRTALLLVDTDSNRAKLAIKNAIDTLENYSM